MAENRWKRLSSEVVHTNPWYEIRKDDVIRPDGKSGEFFVVKTPGPVVNIIALNDKHEIYLVWENRYTLQGFQWEIPGGNAVKDDPKIAAARELKEETGLIAGKMEQIALTNTAEGLLEEDGYLFLATDLTQSEPEIEGNEGIERIKAFSIPAIIQMIKQGELVDIGTIGAIMHAVLYLGYRIEK